MTRNTRTTGDDSGEGREVVVTVDRRLIYGLGLLVAFGIAVGAGMLVSRRAAAPPAVATDGSGVAVDPALAGLAPGMQVDEASARATAAAIGLDTTYLNVVTDTVQHAVLTAPAVDPYAAARGTITPVSELHRELLEDPNTIPIEIPNDPTSQAAMRDSYKPHDVLSNVVDPNVTNPDYAPLRLETVSKPLDGPRLAVSDLNLTNTYDFGVVLMTQRVSHDFVAKNVGTEDLVISRIYTGCGCNATTVGDLVIPADGILLDPITLKPGEEIVFGVEYDASRENRAGASSKYVQIFTNDPTNVRFDDSDPVSHETRFRMVVEPQWATSSGATATP